MRVLVIDDSRDFRTRVAQYLAIAMPDAEVTLWDPAVQGKPIGGFDWGRYDALLLDDVLGPREDGLGWLAEMRASARIPPTLVLSETGGEDMAVKAVKAGASDYLKKADLTPIRLAMSIKEAMLESVEISRDIETLRLTQQLPVGEIGQPPGEHGVNVPGYRILRRIGEGGMSRVYLAERDADGLRLVLKMLDPRLAADPASKARFVREYKIIQRIANEHVVMIFDHGFASSDPWLAMEYFPGGDLHERIRGGISSMGALKILVQIAKALDAVHAAGVVHRDLKPQNIMFRENNRLAILDFGLARELDATSTLTQKGMVMATPLYMSPEQCLGHPHDERGDLYAAGVILYEMLTGHHPFEGDNASSLAYQHVHGEIPRLPKRLSGYQSVLDRLLAKRPDQRFQSARELFSHIAH
jgi:tRNA A-37 threonylcarbamoyl transferase component Bud32/ActR/RegA family two-component response regulator